MAFTTIQSETPKGAVAASDTPAAPPSPVLTADEEADGVKGIRLTLRALKRVRAAMAKENIAPDAGGLRLGITGGGCSGLSYNIRFDSEPRARDRVFSFSQQQIDPVAPADAPAFRIFVDPKSFIYLHGMILDYEETLMRQGFNFINPNSTKSCGCGSSFTA
jgi:iron-sulfur cluster assembly protein